MTQEIEKINPKDTSADANRLIFECFGVKIGISIDDAVLARATRANMPRILPVRRKAIDESTVEHWFSVTATENGVLKYRLAVNSQFEGEFETRRQLIESLASRLRLTVAEYAPDYIFLHAGAVSFEGRAIIIPGKSFSGKTTLVAELIKRNCAYLSDEYAVLDRDGLVHPFTKKLSLRLTPDDYRQTDVSAEKLGGKKQKTPVPVGCLLITEYVKNKKRPALKFHTSGQGVMAALANSISVRRNPKSVLEVLSRVADQATVIKCRRGDAEQFADLLLAHLNAIPRN